MPGRRNQSDHIGGQGEMIEFITKLPPDEFALLAFLWACISMWSTVWICPRLFRFTDGDE